MHSPSVNILLIYFKTIKNTFQDGLTEAWNSRQNYADSWVAYRLKYLLNLLGVVIDGPEVSAYKARSELFVCSIEGRIRIHLNTQINFSSERIDIQPIYHWYQEHTN